MLFHLDPYTIVNSDTIASITEVNTADGRERVEVTFTDGRRKVVNKRFEDLEWIAGRIVPASPGYQVIKAFPPHTADGPTIFETYDVIAFRLTDVEPVPVIPFGKLGESWALVWPDGRCDEQWNRLYPSVEEFKASFGPRGVRS